MVRSILIIKPSSLGDILHAMPAVEALRQRYPAAAIDWVVNDSMAGILGLVPFLRRIIKFPRKSWCRIPGFIRELRKEKYDIVIDFQGLLRSGIIAWLAKGKRKIGFAEAREGATLFYNEKIAVNGDTRHAVDKNLAIAKAITEAEAEATSPTEKSPTPNTLAVCFSSRWVSKDWSLEFLADVINRTASEIPGLQISLIGSATDQEKGKRLAELIQEGKIENLVGKTGLMDLANVLKNSSAMLTVDSGPMHIAAAVGTPCLALFGSTFPEKTGPYGKNHVIIRSKCPQAPCFRRNCPLGANCADYASPAETADELIRILRRPLQ